MEWDKYRRNSKGWDIDNPAQLHPRIMFGSMEIPRIPAITHVINCASNEMSPEWFQSQNPDKYVCLNAIDSPNVNITDWYPKFEETMNQFLADASCNTIYVHCECGINRSAFLCLIYMCKKFGMSMQNVIKNILIQRPCALTNESFRKQVVDYI
jgi:hypothetical protein